MLTNYEDNFAVSRITFEANLKPITDDYLKLRLFIRLYMRLIILKK